MPGLPLAVPMQLDALVVNQAVLSRDTFRWWPFTYKSLASWGSPEPMALDAPVGGQQEGVYLSWTLPDALRHLPADSPAGEYPLVPNRWLIVRLNGTDQRQATAWVLESDCPFSGSAATSEYLVDPGLINAWKSSRDPLRQAYTPAGTDPDVQYAELGVSFPLAQWSERAAQPMFLSAVAPANPLFSSYLAHNLGVFSFYDALDGIDSDTLSYFVAGWYSDPAQDILAPAGADDTAYAKLLQQLGWALAGGTSSATDQSVYHGAAFSVDWDRTGPAPLNDPLPGIQSNKLDVGVGNTTIDAFTALIAPQLNDPAKDQLLRAFQYDLLQQLNEINGDALLDERIRQDWFGSKAGGYSWTIVDNSSDGSTTTTLTSAEQQWLSQLNQAQAQLDSALTTLYSLQWQLHALWLKNGWLSPGADNCWPHPPRGVGLKASPFLDKLAVQLDPGQSGSVAALLVAQFGIVQQLLPQVPQPDWTGTDNAQQAMQNGIAAFSTAKQLDPDKTLKAVAAPRYWQANNPVVVLSGVPAPPSAAGTGALPVRPGDDLVTGFTLSSDTTIGTEAVAELLRKVGSLDAVPTSAAQPLLQEFLLLDPGNAAAIATATEQPQAEVTAVMTTHDPATYTGSLPALTLTGWQQPWTPMFLEWSGTYSAVPFTEDNTPSWAFDGTDYRLTAEVSSLPSEQRTIGGISVLSPHAGVVFGSRLDAFVQQYGTGTELAQIDETIASFNDWQFLAQELTGFNQLLSLRDSRAFRRPTAADQLGGYPVAALTGYGDGTIPPALALPPASQGQVNTVPFLQNAPDLPFHSTRQGGFYFTDFFLYDKFGRTLYVIESGSSSGLFDYKNFPLEIDSALVPDETLVPDVASVLQLPPRLLQHARLAVRLLDATDDTKVYGQDPDVMPVSGWVLPNHLDGSVLVFAPDGTALGEFRLYVQADGSKLGQWTPPPHSGLTLDDVNGLAPHLHGMLTSPQLATEAGFQAFLAAVDQTLWTTDPLGNRADANLSVLVGRPLALLRTRLQFQLDGDPITDTGWAATFTQPAPDFLSCDFSVRLGDQATRQDGVIGYFAASNHEVNSSATDYDVFNSTVAPPAAPAQDYVSVIGPVGSTTTPGNYLPLSFAPQTYQYVTVLADPRAAMHAYTGILPVKQCDIPQQFVDDALRAMEVTFQLGPLLTVLGPSPAQGGTPPAHAQSIAYPTPAEQNGSWSWWEPDATSGTWTGYGLVDASPTATSGPAQNTLREGCLQLITDPDA
ncbi:hypothetical protein ABT010_33325 [Streptomyces sp. NPDC002668]|uniref:hypothetical protein n=1 Tax=Streptomyces sp. NPDC002668 TaxID=3154422 RepID=UPI00332886B6